MTLTHTPGPWRLEPTDRRKHHVDVRGAEGLCVCTIADDEDALLIAAAPELLAALKELVAILDDRDEDMFTDKARAAIAKAEGKQ